MEGCDSICAWVDKRLSDIERNWQRDLGWPLMAEVLYVTLLQVKHHALYGDGDVVQHELKQFIIREFGSKESHHHIAQILSRAFREHELMSYLSSFRATLKL